MMISNELIGYPQWVCFDENKVPHDPKTGTRASCKLVVSQMAERGW